MKKLILPLILLFLLVMCAFCEEWTIGSKEMSVGIEKDEVTSQVRICKIFDVANNQEFIGGNLPNSALWTVSVKKAGVINGREYKLNPCDAADFTVNKTKNTIKMVWMNVRREDMTSGLDVTVTAEVKGNNSYWHIKVRPNKYYGIWYVVFPYIADMDAQEGDMIMFPYYTSGFAVTEFDNMAGFNSFLGHKKTDEKYYLREIGYEVPQYLRYESFTKGKSTLYLCQETSNWKFRSSHTTMNVPHHVNYDVWNYADDMAKGNTGFDMDYKFNISVMKGDWYDAAKRYRKWCIENNDPAFAKGPTKDRKDIPEWLKYNVGWTRWHGDTYSFDYKKGLESVIKTKEFLDVPMACHIYGWSKYQYDTHYPNWLPAEDDMENCIDRMHKAGLKVMPYTNGHLVDVNLSPYYKEYGDVLLAKDEKGNAYTEPWSKEFGAENTIGCITSPYKDVLMKEWTDIIKKYDFDAFYIDQVGGAGQKLCFNPKHSHSMGGGNHYVKNYSSFLEELKKEFYKIKGKNIPLCTEDMNEVMPFDMFLRVNDPMAENEDNMLTSVIFSGYAIQVGSQADSAEFAGSDGEGAINRLASALINGIQPGWNEGGDEEYFRYENLGTYAKKMFKAREAGIEYFSFGESVRKVDFVNNIPYKNLKWTHYTGVSDFDFPVIKTGSFNYKGKTLIVFTNIDEDTVTLQWQSDPKDLNLRSGKIYTISEIYPKEEKLGFTKEIGGEITIGPLETVLVTVE